MASETKWMAVIVEVETYDGEVQSILPIETETTGFFSSDELKAMHKYLREDDDADVDFMWELRGIIKAAAKSE